MNIDKNTAKILTELVFTVFGLFALFVIYIKKKNKR
jgi:hypothetical protein